MESQDTSSGGDGGGRRSQLQELIEYHPHLVLDPPQQPPLKRSCRRPHSRGTLAMNQKSSLQLQFENAIESPGGTNKILCIVQSQDKDSGEIKLLNQSQWTPLVGATFRFGKNTSLKNGNSTKSEQDLVHLIRVCHDKGLSLNSGAWFGEHYHRPLVVASYYGFHSAVKTLLELGALPDLADGEGRTAWFAAFENPVYSGGKRHKFRYCDRQTARVLLDMNAVTSDFSTWKRKVLSSRGSLSYMNGDSCNGSVMLRAIINKNEEVVEFLARNGGVITDRDFLELHKRSQVNNRLVCAVKAIFKEEKKSSSDAIDYTRLNSWHREIDWSFPPTWKLGVVFCQSCGLPPDIFQSHVVPFLSRDWFFTNEDLRGPIPSRLGASKMDLVGFSRDLRWIGI